MPKYSAFDIGSGGFNRGPDAQGQAGDVLKLLDPAARTTEWGTGGGGYAGYAETIGDGAATTFTVTHSLNTTDVYAQVRRLADQEIVGVPITIIDANSLSVEFPTAPALDSYRVQVLAVPEYSTTIGDGATTTFSLVHNLGSQDVLIQVRRLVDDQVISVQRRAPDENTVEVEFPTAPAIDSYRVQILKVI